MRRSRFSCPSLGLELGTLFRKTQRTLWIGLGLAIALHGSLSQVAGLREQASVAKPLTTQFIKRAPRLTKPLELKKRPRPKRRSMQRQMVSVKAKLSQAQRSSAFQPVQVLQSLAGPTAQMERAYGLRPVDLETQVVADAIEGTRDPKDKLSMSLELMDVESLDTGRYHAMVVQDPNDKRNIRGFFHIATVYPTSITKQSMEYINKYVVPGLSNLAIAMNQCTGIKTDLRGRFPFNSRQIFSTPWVYIRYGISRGVTTDGELQVLGQYALSGGFVHVDGHGGPNPWYSEYEALEWMIVHALKLNGFERGRHWEFDQTYGDHPLYHCFFDFERPPTGGHGERYDSAKGGILPQVPYLDTVSKDGRMMVIFCHKWYGLAWSDWRGTRNLGGNTRQLQFGINLLVFALTQEGSITNRVMDTVGGQ